ncbi:MAG: glycosyltransferase family 61 protein [Bacteroidia bacterium]|nr:glycosyltransferase family 61 protein [Bacteroidia bacterium]
MKELRRDAIRLLLYPIRKLPVTSEVFGPPKGIYASVKEWLEQEPAVNGSKGWVQEVFPEHKLYRNKPKTLETKVHWKIRKEYKHQAPAAFITSVKNARLWVNHNFANHVDSMAVISQEDKLIGEISYEFSDSLAKSVIMSKFRLSRAHYFPGKAVSLVTVKGEQFFHWILDILPKLAIMRAAGWSCDKVDYVIVNSTQSRFMRETLALAGVPMEKVITTDDHPHIKVDELLVPSKPSWTGNPPVWVIEFLRELFLPTLPKNTSHLPKKIYISRAKAPVRKVKNEEEIIQYASSAGFTSILLEDYSITDQIAMFAGAEAIIAPHGAGLTHLSFCKPGTKIIEFFSPLYVNACFYSLASVVNLDYYYLIGEGKSPKEGVDLEINIADIELDVAKLKATVEFAGVE